MAVTIRITTGVIVITISIVVLVIGLSSLNPAWNTFQQAKQEVKETCKDLKVKMYRVKSALDQIPISKQTDKDKQSWINSKTDYNVRCEIFTGSIP